MRCDWDIREGGGCIRWKRGRAEARLARPCDLTLFFARAQPKQRGRRVPFTKGPDGLIKRQIEGQEIKGVSPECKKGGRMVLPRCAVAAYSLAPLVKGLTLLGRPRARSERPSVEKSFKTSALSPELGRGGCCSSSDGVKERRESSSVGWSTERRVRP